ncbi:MAG: (2Fe-2S)-binding protein [Ornithinimicrobium sp.]
MSSINPPAPLVDWTLRLEDASVLDRPVRLIGPEIEALFGSGLRGSLLRGDWLGHAVHPVLTDFVLGSWTSATVLDVFGGPESASSARKLVGAGLLVVGPTAWTGWAQWSGSELRDKRVGLVHAATNGLAAGIYAASWIARRRGSHSAGAGLAVAGAAVAGVGGYLGGHLASARHVGSRDAAYADTD